MSNSTTAIRKKTPTSTPMLRKKKDKAEQKAKAKVDEDGYLAFALPWNLTFSYGISMVEDRSKPIRRSNMRYPFSFNQTLNCSGNITLAKGWNINFTSGYDSRATASR